MPKIVAKIQTGGDRIEVTRAITPPTAAEQAKIQACIEKLGVHAAAGAAGRRRRRSGGGLGGGQGGGRAANRARSRSACPSACSASARRSQRRGRRCSRSSTRRRPTSRASRTRSAASSWAIRLRDSSPLPGQRGPVPEGRPRGARLRDLRRPEVAEGRVEAQPERHDVHGRRARESAAGRPGGRRLPAARAAPEALRPEGLVNVVLVRADDSESVGAVEKRSRRRTRRRRSRARSRSPARSAARSSTPRTSLTASASRSRSSPPSRRSCSPRCSRSPRSASACASSGRSRRSGGRSGKVVRQIAGESLAQGVLGGVLGVVLGVGVARPDRRLRADAHRQLHHRRRQPVRRRAGRADGSETISLSAPVGIPILLARLLPRRRRRASRRRRRRLPRGAPSPRRRPEDGRMSQYELTGWARRSTVGRS